MKLLISALINCPQFVRVVTCDMCVMRTDAPGTGLSVYLCGSLTVCFVPSVGPFPNHTMHVLD